MTNLNKKIIWVVVLCWGFLILAGNAFAADSLKNTVTVAEAKVKYRVLSAEGTQSSDSFLAAQERARIAARKKKPIEDIQSNIDYDSRRAEFGVLRDKGRGGFDNGMRNSSGGGDNGTSINDGAMGSPDWLDDGSPSEDDDLLGSMDGIVLDDGPFEGEEDNEGPPPITPSAI